MRTTQAGALMPHPPPPPPPPPDTAVILLMHFDGPSESDSFEDSSIYQRPLTPTGGPFLIEPPTLNGSTVGSFDGDGWVTAPSSTDFDFGTEDFTIECFVYIEASFAARFMFGNVNFGGSPSAGFYMLMSGTQPNFFIYADDGDLYECRGSALSLDAWHHVAVVRDGDFVRVYVDGGRQSLTDLDGAGIRASSGSIKVGGDPEGVFSDFQGYIEELRVTRGVARYTGDSQPPESCFPIPSTPFPNP